MGRKAVVWKREVEVRIEDWTDDVGGRCEEAYRYLLSVTQFSPPVCFVGAWMSLSKDDRGALPNLKALANFLAVSRHCLYDWRINFQLDDWAHQLRMLTLHGMQLGEVDRITYQQAISPLAPVDARRLYYQRAGVLGQDITVHTKTKQEKMHEWLRDLREKEGDDGETVAELQTEAVDVRAVEIRAITGPDTDTQG